MSLNQRSGAVPSSDVSENVIETWKRALAGLVENAPTDVIKNCLRMYNPELPTKDNIKALKSCRKSPIIETLDYLTTSSSSLPSNNLNKDDAIHLLCLKIKNFFPDVCQICQESYSCKLNDKPLISCGACGQEVHRPCYLKLLMSMNLLNEHEKLCNLIFKIPGFCYLCPACQDENINFTHKNETDEVKQAQITNSPTQITEAVEATESFLNGTQPTPRRTLPHIPITPDIIIDRPSNKIVDGIYLGRTNFLKSKFQRELQNDATLSSDNTTTLSSDNTTTKDKVSDETPVCNFYKKGKCKYGITGKDCRFKHPKICTKLLRHGNKSPKGCNAGTKCNMFHPRMCSSSIRKGECFNTNCTFTHVKGTKRDPVLKNHTNTQQSLDFLKILDNFRTEMISMITTNLNVRNIQQPSQTVHQKYPHQFHPRLQDYPLNQSNFHHNKQGIPHQ